MHPTCWFHCCLVKMIFRIRMSGHCFHNQFSAASSAQTALPSPIVQDRVTSDVCLALLFLSHYRRTLMVILGTFTDVIEQDVMS